MNHAWIVEFLHSEGWTPYSVHLSRRDALEQAKVERKRFGSKWKIRTSKFVRADKTPACDHEWANASNFEPGPNERCVKCDALRRIE